MSKDRNKLKAVVTPEQVSTVGDYLILDSDPEKEFDELARLASEICQVPIGVITLLDQNRQWFKSHIGLAASETPIEYSFCKYAAMGENIFEVEDATKDDRFKDNPLVTGSTNIRFYAGAPLVASNGQKIGALCVIDSNPRKLSPFQEEALQILGKQVMTALELRKISKNLISKNTQALKDIEQREQELELATSAASVGIWNWDLATNDIYMTKIERELYGLPLEGAIHYADFARLVHPEDLNNLEATLNRVIQNKSIYSAEFRIIKNNEVRWLNGSGKVYTDEAGNATRFMGVNFDITSVKMDAFEKDNLRIREQAALSATQMKTEFLANMSHEIRTPINGIIGMTKLLLDENLTPEQNHFVESIKKSSSILLVLINDILDLTKIEAGKLALEVIPFSIDKLVRDVVDSFSPLAADKGLKFIVKKKEKQGFFLGDPSRIRQILNNLIGNSLKFTSEGSVELILENVRPDHMEFTVTDSGEGIDEKTMTKLFQNFSQADSSTARKFGGSGLGLAICKKLVELMGGKIFVTSELGVGSTFTFSLPLKEIQEEKMAQSPKTSVLDHYTPELRSHCRILIAEDNPINQEVVLRLLAKAGYRSHAVVNGLEAIKAIRSSDGEEFDLILMDCQMPEMDGYQATEELRKSGVKIPIVALTANAFKEDKEKCLASGMTDYLTKPINFPDLISCLDGHLSEKIRSTPPPKLQKMTDTQKSSGSIDFHIIDRLRFLDEDGSEGLISRLINMFLKLTPEGLKTIRDAHLNNDPLIGKKAHALKSSCVNLGAVKMVKILQEIENGSIEAGHMGKTLDELEHEFLKAKAELENIK